MVVRLAAAAAGGVASRAVHALPCRRHVLARLPVDTKRQSSGRMGGPRQLPATHRRSDLLAGAREQPLVCARHDSAVDRARAADGDLGQRQRRGSRAPASRLLHADGAADDRSGQHLALLLHAGVWPGRESAVRVRRGRPQLARQQEHGARVPDGGRHLEGGRLFHDLLPRRAAIDLAASRRGRGDRGRIAMALLPAGDVSAADADDAVRARQRGDQRFPPGRPRRRDDARRPGQCDLAPPLLHLRDRFPLLGFGLRRCADDGVADDPRPRCLGAILVRRAQASITNDACLPSPRASPAASRPRARGRWGSCGSCRSPTHSGRHFTRRNSRRASC